MRLLSLVLFTLPTLLHAEPWLGAKVDGNSATSYAANKLAMEEWLGRPLDMMLAYGADQHWSNTSGEFIAASYITGQMARCGVPVVLGIPMCPRDGSTRNYLAEEVIPGLRDAEFRRAADQLKSWRPQDAAIYCRIGWEFNGNWYPWGRRNGVTADQFVQAFRRIVDLMRSRNPRLRFVWNPTALWGEWSDTRQWYPGKPWVDVISYDLYWDVGSMGSDPANAFERALSSTKTGLAQVVALARSENLPWALDEWGATSAGGPFVDQVAAYLRDNPPLWQAWWNSDDHYRSKLPGDSNGQRYRANFGLPAQPDALTLTPF